MTARAHAGIKQTHAEKTFETVEVVIETRDTPIAREAGAQLLVIIECSGTNVYECLVLLQRQVLYGCTENEHCAASIRH